ncbi:hypothetical protein BC938DRAFT_477270 [Jimgerdemannia flammicorona]|uniref:Uncharacterized protein n=1 Tax=Jimgerdemannia flammicorona TaxID=994334 RepID=A0A433QPL0_9FUNG|nr:hypothetical protein BC938DRAFT_477270 [Jimgerdemannia flammicorona]
MLCLQTDIKKNGCIYNYWKKFLHTSSINKKIQEIEENHHLTVATETSEQMRVYLRSSTDSVTKRFSNENTSLPSRSGQDEVSELDLEPNEQQDETIGEDSINDGNDDVKEMTQRDLDKFTNVFLKMEDSKKWTLSTGTIVEDALYRFGIKCTHEHLCHSFIVDPDDENLVKEEIFTEAELSEISKYKVKPMPEMRRELLVYLNSFRASTISDLRASVLRPMEWDSPYNRDTHFDYDWTEDLKVSMEWKLGESCSLASSARKNQRRTISAITSLERKTMGRRGDLVIRKFLTEYGCAEAGKIFEGHGTKYLKERGKKTPKMMKDIFDYLCALVEMEEERVRKLQTIGFIHSGLTTVLLRLDSPAGFVNRILRTKSLSIPSDVAEFGSKVLPVILMAWKAKMIVANVIRLVEQDEADDKDEEIQLQLLQDSCESSPPATSKRTMYFPSNMDTPQKKPRTTTRNDDTRIRDRKLG